MRARIAAGRPARPAGGQASMSVLVPTFFGTGNWPIWRGAPTAWARRGQAAGAEGAILQAPGSRVTGPATIMAGHAGSARLRVRIAKSRQGMPTVCSCPAVHPEVRDPRQPQRTRHTNRHPRQHRHSVASANRHRIPAGWKSDAGGWQTAGASAVAKATPGISQRCANRPVRPDHSVIRR
jgi:hypothetical protein